MDFDLNYLLALYNASGGSHGRFARFILGAGPGFVHVAPPFDIQQTHWDQGRKQAHALQSLGIRPLPGWILREVFGDSPALPGVLFVRGEVDPVLESGIGVVGARRAESSLGWVRTLGRELGESGVVVVSGGARGVDAAAHLGAVEVGGRTVAYLGVAADRLYPAENRSLFREILESGGALVSEHPPGVLTAPYHHARRNRFIAMQARHLVIAEAGVKSGTLETVRWARRLKVPLWVPPVTVGGDRAGVERLLDQREARVIYDLRGVFCG